MKVRQPNCRRDSVLARFQLLEAVLSGECKCSTSVLVKACQSQAFFASMNFPEKGIYKMSLNTLKAAANTFIEDGGWRRMDGMRRQLYKISIAAKTTTTKGVSNADHDIDSLVIERRLRLRLETAYLDLLQKLAIIAGADVELAEFLQRHQAGFSLARLKLISGDSNGL